MSIRIFLQLVLLLATVTSYSSSFSLPSTHAIYSAVHHFETLHKAHIYHRVLRDGMYHMKDDLKQVEFTTLGRHFRLMLSPNTRSFHPFLQTKSSDHQHVINYHQFLQGHVFGLEFSHVTAHMTDEGIVTAIITVDNEVYYIEPSHRHIKESHDFHMITYRRSDLKFNMTGNPDEHFCGVSSDHHGDLYDITNPTHFIKQTGNNHTPGNNMRHRLKRQSVPDKVCPINLVATTSFHERFGGSPPEPENTINYLLVVMLQIDAIFQGTDWFIPGVSGSASPGVRGLQIGNVTILTTTDSSPVYNENRGWFSEDLLREFAETDWDDYCISHLFTARSFIDSSRLGVAYIAQADSFLAGGVCSRATSFNNRPFSGNVGVSAYSGADRLLLIGESIVVTAHEIGHNWGSNHDPDTNECSPSQDNGGKYIMYSIAQDGSARNNDMFSNCSIRSITRVINTHESDCFTTPQDTQCGNFRIESGEQCDPGPTAILKDGDMCCTRDCTLKSNFTCSDANHDCCDQCFPSGVDAICLQVEAGNSECFGNRTCNGNDITCPTEQVYVENGTECGIMGLCLLESDNPIRTRCENFCELNNLITCHCNGEDQCVICCKVSSNSTCNPFDNLLLPDGSFCEGGTCQNGECILSDPDFTTFFFDLFTDFSTSAFVQFLYENIVGSVIILSLVFWIPVSVAVHVFDIWWENKREEHKLSRKSKKHDKYFEETKLIEDVDSPSKKKLNLDPEYHTIDLHVKTPLV